MVSDHAHRGERFGARSRLGVNGAEHGNQCEDRDRGDILKQQDRKAESAMRGLEFLAFGEDLQIDRGRRQRKAESDDQSGLPVEPECDRDAADRHGRRTS